MTNDEVLNITDIFLINKLSIARMIGGSKTIYREKHPGDDICFNANIFTIEDGKIWYGDLNITLDTERLQNVANELKKDLYILSEMDGRFENEELRQHEIVRRSRKIIKTA